jgi:hypothetical protein
MVGERCRYAGHICAVAVLVLRETGVFLRHARSRLADALLAGQRDTCGHTVFIILLILHEDPPWQATNHSASGSMSEVRIIKE